MDSSKALRRCRSAMHSLLVKETRNRPVRRRVCPDITEFIWEHINPSPNYHNVSTDYTRIQLIVSSIIISARFLVEQSLPSRLIHYYLSRAATREQWEAILCAETSFLPISTDDLRQLPRRIPPYILLAEDPPTLLLALGLPLMLAVVLVVVVLQGILQLRILRLNPCTVHNHHHHHSQHTV